MTAVGNKLYFIATDGSSGRELWRSDGTTAGTVLVKDMVAGAASPNIQGMTGVNSTLFFAASDPNKVRR